MLNSLGHRPTHPCRSPLLAHHRLPSMRSQTKPGGLSESIWPPRIVPGGMTDENPANICGVPIGIIRSRVARAREQLAELLAVEVDNSFGPDRVT